MCAHTRGQRKDRVSFFKHLPMLPPPPLFLSERGCLTGLGLIKLAVLAGQCISTAPDLGLHMYVTIPHIFFTWLLGLQLTSSNLQGKHFIG